MSTENEFVVMFPITGGIFGVGRLASRLTALVAAQRIGEWHVGNWLDHKHTAIRIRFNNAADAGLARSVCSEAAMAATKLRD